jgi:hypothetical protein
VDDLQKTLGIVIHHDLRLFTFDAEHQILRVGQRVQAFGNILDERQNIALNVIHFQGVRLQLSQVKNLIDESQEVFSAAFDQAEFIASGIVFGFVFCQLLTHAQHDRERRSEFVGDIGKKSAFEIVEFFQTQFFLLRKPLAQQVLVIPPNAPAAANSARYRSHAHQEAHQGGRMVKRNSAGCSLQAMPSLLLPSTLKV